MKYRGESITIAPPEYVILRKLEYFRERWFRQASARHSRYAAVSGDQLDRPALVEEWIWRQGLAAEWARSLNVVMRTREGFAPGPETISLFYLEKVGM